MNEAIVTVKSIKFDDNTNIYDITIKVINTRFQLVLRWHNYKRKDTYERSIYKTTFPIILVNKVIVKKQNEFALGLTYVMLSWITIYRKHYLYVVILCQIISLIWFKSYFIL
jgi:ABC-type transport system involved in Fe-S cluster assembly fused permease/ATPase subunit